MDVDNGDDVYSANDTIVVRFDVSTDRAGGAPSGGRAYVDGLFNFSDNLGADYEGEWIDDASKFVVTVKDVSNNTISLVYKFDSNGTAVVLPTRVTLNAPIRSARGNSLPITGNLSHQLVGHFGDNSSDAFPRVASLTGREIRRQLEWELTLVLDRATDQGRAALPKGCGDPLGNLASECVDILFNWLPADAFTATIPPSQMYTASWTDTSSRFRAFRPINATTRGTGPEPGIA